MRAAFWKKTKKQKTLWSTLVCLHLESLGQVSMNVTGWSLRGQRGLQVFVAEVGVAALDRPPGLSVGRVLSIRAIDRLDVT